MKRLFIYSFWFLLLACNVEKPRYNQHSTERFRLFEIDGKEYDLNIFSMRNGVKKYSIRINGVAYGPIIEKDSVGQIKEVKIFWNDTLIMGKNYYWNNSKIDSVEFYTYKKLQPNKYAGIKRMRYASKGDSFVHLRFPLFDCEKQRTTLCQRNFDNTFLFPYLHEEPNEKSYIDNEYYRIGRFNNEVHIVNENIENDKATFAVDFTNNTADPNLIDMWHVLFVHPTIIIKCDSLSETLKQKVMKREFVF